MAIPQNIVAMWPLKYSKKAKYSKASRPLTTHSTWSGRSSPVSVVLSRQRAFTPAIEHSMTWTVDYTSPTPSDVCFRNPVFTWVSLLLIYRPRKDERPSWLTHSGQFTHRVVTSQTINQDRESSPVKDQRSTTVLHYTANIYI